MKKFNILFLWMVAFVPLTYGQQDSMNLEDCPFIDEYLKPLWKVGLSTKDGAPLLVSGYFISTFCPDSAIVLNTGEKIGSPLNLPTNINIVFESKEEIIIKNVKTNETLFYDRREAGISMRKDLKIINNPIFVYQKEKNKLVAYDLVKQKQNWEYFNDNPIRNNFIVIEDRVFIFDKIGLKVLNGQNGSFLWANDIGDVYATPYLVGSKLFALTNRNGLYCINIKKQKVDWVFKDQNSHFGEKDMLIDNNRLYFTSEWLYAVDFDGKLIWSSKYPFYYDISIVNDVIIAYLQYAEPIITVIDKKTGKPLYFNTFGSTSLRYEINSPMRFSGPIGNKIVAEPAFSNEVFCFEILK